MISLLINLRPLWSVQKSQREQKNQHQSHIRYFQPQNLRFTTSRSTSAPSTFTELQLRGSLLIITRTQTHEDLRAAKAKVASIYVQTKSDYSIEPSLKRTKQKKKQTQRKVTVSVSELTPPPQTLTLICRSEKVLTGFRSHLHFT